MAYIDVCTSYVSGNDAISRVFERPKSSVCCRASKENVNVNVHSILIHNVKLRQRFRDDGIMPLMSVVRLQSLSHNAIGATVL